MWEVAAPWKATPRKSSVHAQAELGHQGVVAPSDHHVQSGRGVLHCGLHRQLVGAAHGLPDGDRLCGLYALGRRDVVQGAALVLRAPATPVFDLLEHLPHVLGGPLLGHCQSSLSNESTGVNYTIAEITAGEGGMQDVYGKTAFITGATSGMGWGWRRPLRTLRCANNPPGASRCRPRPPARPGTGRSRRGVVT